jgi:hypothetical protein
LGEAEDLGAAFLADGRRAEDGGGLWHGECLVEDI